jgi:hypothetical protein
MSAGKPREGQFQLLAATTMRRLLQAMQDPCAEAEGDPLASQDGPEIVLSAAAGRVAGKSLIFAADGAIAAPDWLALCETSAATEKAGAVFGLAGRLSGAADPTEFARRACALIWAAPPAPDRFAGMAREEALSAILSAPEALARRWRFALLPLDGELSAVFGTEGFDELAPPRFVVED